MTVEAKSIFLPATSLNFFFVNYLINNAVSRWAYEVSSVMGIMHTKVNTYSVKKSSMLPTLSNLNDNFFKLYVCSVAVVMLNEWEVYQN
jgi:hypothetical protein